MLLLLGQNLGMLGNQPPVFDGPIPSLNAVLHAGEQTIDASEYFAGAATYTIEPDVEAGWDFDEDTGVLEVDTDVAGTFGPYIVTATNLNGDTPSNEFTVTIVTVAYLPPPDRTLRVSRT